MRKVKDHYWSLINILMVGVCGTMETCFADSGVFNIHYMFLMCNREKLVHRPARNNYLMSN